MEQTFEQFKKEWFSGAVIHQILWHSQGDEHQREFYLFNGVQVIVNTCFPFVVWKKNTVYFIVDCVLPKNKETELLLKKYNGTMNDWCLYTEETNVCVPQFDTEDDMLRFMYEVDCKKIQVSVTYY